MKKNKDVIQLTGITKIYKKGSNSTVGVRDVDLTISEGEFAAIMGPSGSGKSTLMNIIGLLDRPTSGTYKLDDVDVSKIKASKIAEIRNRKIGFVFQQFNLLSRTTALDNVLLPTLYGDVENPKEKAMELLKKVGLEDRVTHRPNQLSGGQLQRVAIARALIMDPSLLLADEPTGNLDSHSGEEILELFKEINKNGVTVLLITHDNDIASNANRIISIRDGNITSDKKIDHGNSK